MVDFDKLKMRPRKNYIYVCDKCQKEEAYIFEMPEHLLRSHIIITSFPYKRYCGGKLKLVRTEDR